jgi:hypothetical protein
MYLLFTGVYEYPLTGTFVSKLPKFYILCLKEYSLKVFIDLVGTLLAKEK